MKKIVSIFSLILFIALLSSCGGKQKDVKLTNPDIDAIVHAELGHYYSIYALAFSPDEKTIATSGYEGGFIIWNIATKHQVLHIQPQTPEDYKKYSTLIYTSDGKQLIAGTNGAIEIFNTENGEKIKTITIKGYGDPLTISQDDKYLATDGGNYSIDLIDLTAGTITKSFEGHTSSLKALAITADNKFLLSASADSTLRIWDIETGELVKEINADNTVKLLAVSDASDKFAFCVYGKKEVEIWDMKSLKKINTIATDAEAIFFKGNNLLSHEYSDVKLFNTETGEKISSIEDYGYGTVLSKDYKYIGTAGLYGVRIVDLENGDIVAEFGKDTRYVSKINISPTEKFILTENSHKSGSGGPDILSYAVDTTSNFSAYPTSGSGGNIMDFFGNTDQIYAEEYYGEMIHYDLATGKALNKIEDKFTDPICITSDGVLLVGKDKEKNDSYGIFNAKTGELLTELINTSAYHYFSGITPDDKYFVMLTMDFFKVWELPSGKEIKSYKREDMDGVVFVDMTKDGKYIVGREGSYDFLISDIMTGENIFLAKGINPEYATLNPDKNTVAVGCDDWTVKVYDIAQNTQTQTLKGHFGYVKALAFTGNGKFLLSAAQDDQILVWDNVGNLVLTIIGLEKIGDYDGETKDWLAFAPNGRYDGSDAGIAQFLYFEKDGKRLPASDYKDKCYTPDLIGQTLGQNFIEFKDAE